MFYFAPLLIAPPAQCYVDTIDKKEYNSIISTYNITDMYDKKVITMNTGLLSIFSSKLNNFYKYAPKEVLEAFYAEFVPQLKAIAENPNEEELFNLLDSWFDTIDIYSNPETVSRLEESLKDIENGDFEVWTPQSFLK